MKKRIRMKKMKNEYKKCYFCDGHGVYEDFYDDAFGGTHSIGFWECSLCNGTGKISVLKDFRLELISNKMVKILFKKEIGSKSEK